MMMTTTLFRFLLSIIFIVVIMLFLISYIDPVLAHKEFQFGNVTIEPGWVTEPPLVGQLNNIEVTVTRGGGVENQQPVRNAFANLNADIKFGGITKSLDFQPSEESAATYMSEIIPTSVGSYSLVLQGQVENQNISTTVPIEDVEDISKLAFPQLGSGSRSSSDGMMATTTTTTSTASPSYSTAAVDSNVINAISNQIRDLVSDMSGQLTGLNQDLNTTRQIAEQALNSIEQSESRADRAYTAGMIGIGTGIAGIILAVLFTRKDSVKENKGIRISPKKKSG
jgi:hypothetical protein